MQVPMRSKIRAVQSIADLRNEAQQVGLGRELRMPSSKIMSLAVGRVAGKSAGIPSESLGKLTMVSKSGPERPTSKTKKVPQKSEDGKSKKTR